MPATPPREVLVSEAAVPDDTVIWRYFPFEPFVKILETHSLWFSRPFRWDDEWEGHFPPSYIRRTRQYTDANGIAFEEFDREFRKRLLRHRYAHLVNCWHVSDHESDAMWKLYGLGERGIAFQSTVGDFRECLRPHNDGQVIYYDPTDNVGNLCQPPKDLAVALHRAVVLGSHVGIVHPLKRAECQGTKG